MISAQKQLLHSKMDCQPPFNDDTRDAEAEATYNYFIQHERKVVMQAHADHA